MKKIIINADDCGFSADVNACIEKGIQLGKITSTTIMANMQGFDGAVRLYKKYGDVVSFGWHINLDEGEALTRSQVLLDKGFFREENGRVHLNGGGFRRSFLDGAMRIDIRKELKTQWEKIRDNGVEITHTDSHHFYHTQPCMIQIIPELFRELGIKRCRRVANYGVTGLSRLARSAWAAYFRLKGVKMPDTFSSFYEFYQNPNRNSGYVIELMCHPGHPSPEYQQEFSIIKAFDVQNWDAKLISYKDI